jgi:hypothetical protein
MSKLGWFSSFLFAAFLVSTGCESTHEKGVKSNLHTQWADVAASTAQTTDAAKAVLEAEGLRDVKANSTAMDGEATGKMADGTKVTVSVKKKGDTSSQVSVNLGSLGSPKMGAELAKKIKMRAEGA